MGRFTQFVDELYVAGKNFFNPMTAAGDIIYGGVDGLPTRLEKGADGKFLTLVSGVPVWQAVRSSPLYFNALAVAPSAVVGTWIREYEANSAYNGRFYNSSNATADSASFAVILPKGTYTIAFSYMKSAFAGKVDVYLDATKILSLLDLYAASPAWFLLQEITGIACDGAHTLKFTVNGKHASSGGYYCFLAGFSFKRTGD